MQPIYCSQLVSEKLISICNILLFDRCDRLCSMANRSIHSLSILHLYSQSNYCGWKSYSLPIFQSKCPLISFGRQLFSCYFFSPYSHLFFLYLFCSSQTNRWMTSLSIPLPPTQLHLHRQTAAIIIAMLAITSSTAIISPSRLSSCTPNHPRTVNDIISKMHLPLVPPGH